MARVADIVAEIADWRRLAPHDEQVVVTAALAVLRKDGHHVDRGVRSLSERFLLQHMAFSDKRHGTTPPSLTEFEPSFSKRAYSAPA
tara:strand:- start:54 stop:314 length:261 start_codon:yes stop_codon:yes gene_type:complete